MPLVDLETLGNIKSVRPPYTDHLFIIYLHGKRESRRTVAFPGSVPGMDINWSATLGKFAVYRINPSVTDRYYPRMSESTSFISVNWTTCITFSRRKKSRQIRGSPFTLVWYNAADTRCHRFLMITQCLNKALVIDKIQNGKKLYSVCYKWQTSSTDHLAGWLLKYTENWAGALHTWVGDSNLQTCVCKWSFANLGTFYTCGCYQSGLIFFFIIRKSWLRNHWDVCHATAAAWHVLGNFPKRESWPQPSHHWQVAGVFLLLITKTPPVYTPDPGSSNGTHQPWSHPLSIVTAAPPVWHQGETPMSLIDSSKVI